MHDAANIARTWHADGRTGVLACVIAARGLGVAANGDYTVIDEHNALAAPLLGGALDAGLPALCAELVASADVSRMHTVSIDDCTAEAAGLTCAGEVDVVLQRIDTLPVELWDALASGRPVALSTSVGLSGSVVHLGDRVAIGTFADAAIDDEAQQAATGLLTTPGNNVVALEVAGRSILVQSWNPMPQVIILGANALAGALRAQFELLGWTATIIDDGDLASSAFVESHPGDAVLVLDHSPAVTSPLLAAALRANRGYVGALGSRKTQVMRRTHLERAGLTGEELARLHGPAGLDIGNRTTAETAVSIAAEIIAFRSGRSARPLQSTSGAITK